MRFGIFLLWLLVAFALQIIDTKRDYTIEILDIKHNISSDITFIKTLNVSTIKMKVSSLELCFDRDITVVPGEASLSALTKSGRRILLFRIKSEVCQLLAEGIKNIFISIFMKEVLRNSNLPSKCPMLKNVLYTVKNYTIDDDSYPPYLPACTWQFDLKGRPNHIGYINVSLIGRVRKL